MPVTTITNAQQRIRQAAFRLPLAPVYRDSLILYTPPPDAKQAISNLAGVIAGDFTGSIEEITGLVLVNAVMSQAAQATTILPSAIRANVVGYGYLPTDPQELGLDGTLLPPNGRVPIFWKGARILVHSTNQDILPSPLSAGQQIQLSRTNLAYARLYDQAGTRVATSTYGVTLGTGLVTLSDPLNLSAYQQPLVCEHRIQDLCTVEDVQLNGKIQVVPPLGHAYDKDDTYISSVIYLGNLSARAYPVYDGSTWQNVWSETLIGDEPLAEYDLINYPIEVDNESAVGDEFICLFRTSQQFDFIGRNRGIIASGRITEDFEPINSLTGKHFLKIKKEGWGSGWSVGNYLYSKIVPASKGLWAIRTILPNRSASQQDQIKIEFWGNASV